MRIPQDKIEDIRNSTDIVDVISGYVQLKKRGRSFIGLCPFHTEKTPSFTVSPEKQIFHCFGCHKGGNVFSFLMEYKSISFIEAVQETAESAGIKLELTSDEKPGEKDKLEELYEINVFAAKFFSGMLADKGKGTKASEYLTGRNLKTKSLKSFGIGFAPDSWDNFLEHAKKGGINLDDAQTLGLLDTNDKGKKYDKFRNRIIFPIFSPNGRVIAFGGRTLENRKDIAKYLNSPESEIYQKRRSLYGLYHSKEEIRKLDRAILVEGYMDLISLFQAGIKNVVASSGTALTPEQVRLLSRYTKNILVLFDADPAGQKAAERSIEVLLKQDFAVKILTLPDGEDPDSYVTKYGKEKFLEISEKGVDFLEFLSEYFTSKGMFDDPAKETEAIRKLVETVSWISDELKRSLTIKNIAGKYKLRERLLESELDKYLKQNRVRENIQNKRENQAPALPEQAPEGPSKGKVSSVEKDIINALLECDDEIAGIIFDHFLPEEFKDDSFRKLAELIYKNFTEHTLSLPRLMEQIEDENFKKYVSSVVMNFDEISHKRWEEFTDPERIRNDKVAWSKDLVKKINLIRLSERINEINNRIAGAENDHEKLFNLFKEKKELEEEKKNIHNNDNLALY